MQLLIKLLYIHSKIRAINESNVRTSRAGFRPARGIRTAAQAPPPRSWRHPSKLTAGSWVSRPKFYDEYNVKHINTCYASGSGAILASRISDS